ncbi:MAG TPA: hypothetical protein VM429_06850, partial [Micropruina sp.]|nr:hypothetical protein [Micropruina sp.]
MRVPDPPEGTPGLMGPLTDTERAVLRVSTLDEVLALFTRYAERALGSRIAEVRFRAGRIDAVWGVVLRDGRQVVIKAFRTPADVAAIAAANEAKSVLVAFGYPCAQTLSGLDEVDGRLLTAEAMLTGGVVPDGLDPAVRRLLAAGLAQHIELLRSRTDLLGQGGRPRDRGGDR